MKREATKDVLHINNDTWLTDLEFVDFYEAKSTPVTNTIRYIVKVKIGNKSLDFWEYLKFHCRKMTITAIPHWVKNEMILTIRCRNL